MYYRLSSIISVKVPRNFFAGKRREKKLPKLLWNLQRRLRLSLVWQQVSEATLVYQAAREPSKTFHARA